MHHRSYRFLFCISFQSVSVKSNSLCAPAFFHGVQFLPQCLIYWCLRGGIQRGIIGSAGYLCDSHLRGDICLRLLRKPYPVMSLATPWSLVSTLVLTTQWAHVKSSILSWFPKKSSLGYPQQGWRYLVLSKYFDHCRAENFCNILTHLVCRKSSPKPALFSSWFLCQLSIYHDCWFHSSSAKEDIKIKVFSLRYIPTCFYFLLQLYFQVSLAQYLRITPLWNHIFQLLLLVTLFLERVNCLL